MIKTALVCYLFSLLVVTEVTKATVNAQETPTPTPTPTPTTPTPTTPTPTTPTTPTNSTQGNGAAGVQGPSVILQMVFAFTGAVIFALLRN